MESIIGFIQAMPFWYWWVLAAALLTIELMTGSTYFLWPAISATAVGLFVLGPFGGAWQMQLIMFAVITVALSVFAPKHVKPWLHRSQMDHMTLNDRGAQEIGRRATVEETFSNGSGRVRLGDISWLAESVSGGDLVAGDQVVVSGSEGVKLYVKPVA